MRVTSSRATKRHGSPSALRRTIGVLVCGLALLASGCTAPTSSTESTTRVLQAVDIALNPGGEIFTMTGNTVFLDEESGATRSERTSYDPAEAVDGLPVRLTTKYRAGERTGSNLEEISGFSGRIELDLTLENLLIASEHLTYDAAGESRTSPALVGTPLSVAASTELPGIHPDSIVFDIESPRRTNGVVSASPTGSTVQWAALLAPPRSEATLTFTLVADVRDFKVPEFNIAVQAGLHTDLSFAGVTASAFAEPSAELEAQQRAIDLVTEVNGVLTRAGATITEIRKNLSTTSDTLGVRASRRLAESSEQLTSVMASLSGQILELERSLDGSVNGASSAMRSELAQIVKSIGSILGDTTSAPPELIDGAGCAAKIQENEQKDVTVFSMFLHLSALLDGYADAAEGCRDEIASAIDALIGPEEPDEAGCDALTQASATCALFRNTQSLLTSLDDLVVKGQAIIAGIDTATIDQGLAAHDVLTTTLDDTAAAIATLADKSDDTGAWESLLAQTEEAQGSASGLEQLRAGLLKMRDALEPGGSDYSQQEHVAEMLCDLVVNGGASDLDGVEEIRAQLVDNRCDGAPHQAGDIPAQGSSTQRMADQAAALEASISALDPNDPESAISELKLSLAKLHGAVESTADTIKNGSSELQQSAKQLQQLHAAAVAQSTEVREKLEAALLEQGLLGGEIDDAFEQAKNESASAISSDAAKQVADLNAQRGETESALSESYQLLIDGLRASAAESIVDGRSLVREQKDGLKETQRQAVRALDERTTGALASIERSTAAANRDVRSAAKQMSSSLKSVILDLGNPKVRGSGILGALSTNAAKSDTADYQLALASQYASGYANVRGEDVAGILLRQAQFRAALDRTASLAPFRLQIPKGATSQTIYAFTIGTEAR